MKKIILGFLIVFGLIGCGRDIMIDIAYYEELDPIKFYDFAEYDLSNIKTFTDIGYFLQAHITYKDDNPNKFSGAENTMKRGYGDCEDYVIVFINIAYIVFGIKMDLLIVDTTNRTVVNGGIGDHVIVGYNGKTYSGQWGHELDYTNILYKYTFNEVLY